MGNFLAYRIFKLLNLKDKKGNLKMRSWLTDFLFRAEIFVLLTRLFSKTFFSYLFHISRILGRFNMEYSFAFIWKFSDKTINSILKEKSVNFIITLTLKRYVGLIIIPDRPIIQPISQTLHSLFHSQTNLSNLI